MGRQEDKPELLFADLPPGRTFRTLEYPVTREMVREFMETVGDRHPLYWDENLTAQGAPGYLVAPPGLAAVYARLSYLQDHSMPSGGVLARQEFEFHHPVRVGAVLQVSARVIESGTDEKGRKRVTFLIRAKDQAGQPACTIRLYAIWPK